jgi:7-alpha-hydroxysteroid dehydrogenase
VTTFYLTGETALVTGVSRGVGRALAPAGADVALSARDEASLRELAEQVGALGRKAVVLPADVTDAQACRPSGRTRSRRWGRSTCW